MDRIHVRAQNKVCNLVGGVFPLSLIVVDDYRVQEIVLLGLEGNRGENHFKVKSHLYDNSEQEQVPMCATISDD